MWQISIRYEEGRAPLMLYDLYYRKIGIQKEIESVNFFLDL